MKTNKLKTYLKFGILLLGSSLILISCQTDSETIEPTQKETDFTMKPKFETFSLQQLEKDAAFNNLKNNYGILQNKLQFKYANGNSYSARLVDTLGITIDANTIKKIAYENYVSYTMLMIEPDDTSGNISNLVIQNHNGSERIFTVRYTNLNNESDTASRNSSQSGNVQMRSGIRSSTEFWQDDESNSGGSGTDNCEQYIEDCYTVNVWTPVCCGCGDCGNDPCEGCYGNYAGWELGTEEECENICVDYGSNNYDPGSSNPNTGGGGSTSDDTTPTEVATTPINTDGTSAVSEALANLLNITDETFLKCISTPQYEEPVSEALSYLTENNATSDAKSFAIQGLQAVCEGFNDLAFDELIELLEFEQDYRGRMSDSEIELFDTLTRDEQLNYLWSAKQASDKTEELFSTFCENYNGKGDAFRHAYWNALSTQRLGAGITNLLTTRHEDKPPTYAYNWKENEMDLFNNQVGRNIASDGSTNLVQDILVALNNGELRYINNQSSDCKATFSSQIIPTNQ